MDGVRQAWEHLTAATPPPTASGLAVAVVVGAVLVLWGRSWWRVRTAVTIAHEGGHAAAAILTRRRVMRVHINSDSSGTTYTWGKRHGFGEAFVAFAGYPFPALIGAGLLIASVSGSARTWASATAVALLLLLVRTRNLHGWFIVGLCLLGIGMAAWYLPDEPLALGLAALGALLFAGAGRSLTEERRSRRAGSSDSDVSSLGRRGRIPAGFWWFAMAVVVIGSGWLAWTQVAVVYDLA